ncbi:unnamed protein product [Paramecium sonneborni]|uniref:Uncharacterized protein n=1 Tax=Paramecium sonneborni TaxID=65129 RepID=A0A8S1RNE1_9CILI|nr:unnamed protein product [Paramecium sonneborni]
MLSFTSKQLNSCNQIFTNNVCVWSFIFNEILPVITNVQNQYIMFYRIISTQTIYGCLLLIYHFCLQQSVQLEFNYLKKMKNRKLLKVVNLLKKECEYFDQLQNMYCLYIFQSTPPYIIRIPS